MRVLALMACGLVSSYTLLAETAQERLVRSTEVLNEIMATPDKGIPQDLLDSAHCVVIVPGLKKGAFIVGGKYGKGYAVCRESNGVGWGDPAGVIVEGGSFGFQIGGAETDVVMLVMNKHGMNELTRSKFTIGADATAAAGPVGRTTSAETGGYLRAEILSWSRSRGAFAGIALTGATLRQDMDANKELYGRALTNREILVTSARMRPPDTAARQLDTALDHYSPRLNTSKGTAAREAKPNKKH